MFGAARPARAGVRARVYRTVYSRSAVDLERPAVIILKNVVSARLEQLNEGCAHQALKPWVGKGAPAWLYETVYCARGQAENLIKMHKTELASDRTSCLSPSANRFRRILHIGAYWLLHGLRAAAPKASDWARAEFATVPLGLIKIAARVVEKATRIRVSLPSACPYHAIFALLARRLAPRPP